MNISFEGDEDDGEGCGRYIDVGDGVGARHEKDEDDEKGCDRDIGVGNSSEGVGCEVVKWMRTMKKAA